jgi:four helix bundle suffix protein
MYADIVDLSGHSKMAEVEKLLPKHSGYRKLKGFQVARLVFDITVRFCERYIDRFSRTRDQMVQAARSGVQNIAEGSAASAASKKTELQLTNVARSSLEELRLDYEDFLRHRNLRQWPAHSPLRQELVDKRFQTADEVAGWVKDISRRTSSTESAVSTLYPEITANAALVLINVAASLLNRQIQSLAEQFENEGGFTERLYRVRTAKRSTHSQRR